MPPQILHLAHHIIPATNGQPSGVPPIVLKKLAAISLATSIAFAPIVLAPMAAMASDAPADPASVFVKAPNANMKAVKVKTKAKAPAKHVVVKKKKT
jgi:hypothetical protein